MKKYVPRNIEEKWQEKWEKDRIYKASDTSKKPKYYCLDMFPYPSGDGLHVGHFKGYCATDVISRYLRMKGFNVLHPMGWDAFGLPAENYAIKTGVHPQITTQKAISKIKKQMQMAGFSYDWSREINTTDPDYYKWTQWIFLKMFEKGLAYEVEAPINWCPSCKTGLANEEVVAGRCERCGTKVTKKNLRQWALRITKYADLLLEDLKDLDWPQFIKLMQENWIGRSEGAEVDFKVKNYKDILQVFTTRPDTLFGATFMVLAPEHELVSKIVTHEQKKEVSEYVKKALEMSDLERTEEKVKTGVFTGAYAVNSVNGKDIPIWVADYVLSNYGTGAIMAVPAHDGRDWEFAKKYNLAIIEVISGGEIEKEPYVGEGKLVNSDQFSGLHSKEAIAKVTDWLQKKGLGKKTVNYKLRDWLFSRQRYWGEPIPIVHCPECGVQAVDEKDLPIKLPEVKKYEPTGTGESPLASIPEFVNTKCPKCDGPAKRETNTMPQWAGSCWYYLRYCDTKNNSRIIDQEKEKYWIPVDWYVGGAEHAVLHLLYARFWHKFLFDIGVVSSKEPFLKLRNVGLVLGEGGIKMSKSRGNVIAPDEIIEKYGADTLRLYELFMGPFDQSIAWDSKSVEGVNRFLYRVWDLVTKVISDKKQETSKTDLKLERLINQLIKKVGDDIEEMKFNTAIAKMMEFLNEAQGSKHEIPVSVIKLFVQILAPFAPHIVEELWQEIGKGLVHQTTWPTYDKKILIEDVVVIPVQINGRVRDQMTINFGTNEEEIAKKAKESERIKKYLSNNKIIKTIVVPNKLINFVIK